MLLCSEVENVYSMTITTYCTFKLFDHGVYMYTYVSPEHQVCPVGRHLLLESGQYCQH